MKNVLSTTVKQKKVLAYVNSLVWQNNLSLGPGFITLVYSQVKLQRVIQCAFSLCTQHSYPTFLSGFQLQFIRGDSKYPLSSGQG